MLSTAATLLDGNPSNNFLKRAAAFNPDGIAERRAQPRDRRQLRLHPLRPRAGRRRHLTDPMKPTDRLGDRRARHSATARSIAVQFRYAFVTDEEASRSST